MNPWLGRPACPAGHGSLSPQPWKRLAGTADLYSLPSFSISSFLAGQRDGGGCWEQHRGENVPILGRHKQLSPPRKSEDTVAPGCSGDTSRDTAQARASSGAPASTWARCFQQRPPPQLRPLPPEPFPRQEPGSAGGTRASGGRALPRRQGSC